MDSQLVPPPSGQFAGMDHAENYLRYRPEWPQELVLKNMNFLTDKKSKPFKLALDVGCGSGQSSRPLAPHFENVIGIDVSEAQIEVARTAVNPKNVEFIVGSAEKIPLPGNSVDLITCGASFHWFDKDAFFAEIDRVLKPCGCVAIYSYTGLLPWVEGDDAKNAKMEQAVDEFWYSAMDQYFSERTKHIEDPENLQVPYAEYRRDDTVFIYKESTVDLFVNFVRTLSGYQNYIERNSDGEDILNKLKDRILDILGVSSVDTKIYQRGRVYMFLGRKPNGDTH